MQIWFKSTYATLSAQNLPEAPESDNRISVSSADNRRFSWRHWRPEIARDG